MGKKGILGLRGILGKQSLVPLRFDLSEHFLNDFELKCLFHTK